MADLGTIANQGLLTKEMDQNGAWALGFSRQGLLTKGSRDQGPRWMLRSLMLGPNYQCRGGRSDLQGNPTAPSLRIQSRGKWRFRWNLSEGTHEISVKVKQDVNFDPRPTLTVKANPEIGLMSDVVGVAEASFGWITIGPLSVTVSTKGATWVEFNTRYESQDVQSYWDYLTRT